MLLYLSSLSAKDACCMERLKAFVFSLLPAEQRVAIERFKQTQDQYLRVLVRALLACGLYELEGCLPSDSLPRLRVESLGRPYVQGAGRPISFSHAEDMVACLIGETSPIGEGIAGVGVDIERLRNMPLHELAPGFSNTDIQAIKNAPDTTHELFARWTAKEALLKALGVGFWSDPLAVDTSVSPVGTLHWRNLTAPQGYTLAVAAPWEMERVTVQLWNPESCLRALMKE